MTSLSRILFLNALKVCSSVRGREGERERERERERETMFGEQKS